MTAIETILKTIPHEKGILQISLNRPDQLNALSHELLNQLQTLIQQIKDDKNIKAILVTGEGKGFCAGADIKQLASLNGQAGLNFAKFGQSVFRQLELVGKPSIAVVHGFAFGGGCELAMAASLRFAANNAVFGQPEIKLGVIPGFGGTQRLSRLIGKGRALEICLSGRRFSAEEAHKWGLVNQLSSPEKVFTDALAFAQDLTSFSPIALQSIITVTEEGYNLSLEEALELEAAHFGLCCTSLDKKEGVNAFLEKRVAVFTGE